MTKQRIISGWGTDVSGDVLDPRWHNFLTVLLIEATRDLQGRSEFLDSSESYVRASAARWFSENEVYACPRRGLSFGWVCEHLGLDVDSVRERAFCGEIQTAVFGSGPRGEREQVRGQVSGSEKYYNSKCLSS